MDMILLKTEGLMVKIHTAIRLLSEKHNFNPNSVKEIIHNKFGSLDDLSLSEFEDIDIFLQETSKYLKMKL